jgi:hypothetical protein
MSERFAPEGRARAADFDDGCGEGVFGDRLFEDAASPGKSRR